MERRTVEHAGGAAEDDERQEDERREKRVEEQYGNDGVTLQRLLLERIVATQQGCRHKGEYQPHITAKG